MTLARIPESGKGSETVALRTPPQQSREEQLRALSLELAYWQTILDRYCGGSQQQEGAAIFAFGQVDCYMQGENIIPEEVKTAWDDGTASVRQAVNEQVFCDIDVGVIIRNMRQAHQDIAMIVGVAPEEEMGQVASLSYPIFRPNGELNGWIIGSEKRSPVA